MDTINIIVSSDTNFIPVLGVMLHSLVSARQNSRRIDVYLFCHLESFDDALLRRLEKQLLGYDNISIDLIDVSEHKEIASLPPGLGYAPAAYYRVLAPTLLSHLEKALYLDCDVIVKTDIGELYDIDLHDNFVAACKDTDVIGHLESPINNLVSYMNELEIRDMTNYFNSGVLLMNLRKLREENLYSRMIQYTKTHCCNWPDNDALNYFCQDRVLYLDKAWNSLQLTKTEPHARYAPNDEWKSFIKGCANEKIVHYTVKKPWEDTGANGADLWWSYARQTDWYEMMLQRLVSRQSRVRGVQEEVDIALSRMYDATWLRGNLMELITWNETHTYAALIDIANEREAVCDTDDATLKRLKTSRVVFYGAGYWCRNFLRIYDWLEFDYPAEIWDVNANAVEPQLYGVPVRKPDFQSLGTDDIVAITVINDSVNREISDMCKYTLTHNDLKAALAHALWQKKAEREGN